MIVNQSSFFRTFLNVQRFQMNRIASAYGRDIDKSDGTFKSDVNNVEVKYNVLNTIGNVY